MANTDIDVKATEAYQRKYGPLGSFEDRRGFDPDNDYHWQFGEPDRPLDVHLVFVD